jgi:hypothetical protein
VTDKSAINRGNVIREAESWLRFDYGKYFEEWAYSRIDPLVVVEEFIKSNAKSADGVPWDYKFFVFDGKCAMIQVDMNRFSRHARTLFTRQWEREPFSRVTIGPKGPGQVRHVTAEKRSSGTPC